MYYHQMQKEVLSARNNRGQLERISNKFKRELNYLDMFCVYFLEIHGQKLDNCDENTEALWNSKTEKYCEYRRALRLAQYFIDKLDDRTAVSV